MNSKEGWGPAATASWLDARPCVRHCAASASSQALNLRPHRTGPDAHVTSVLHILTSSIAEQIMSECAPTVSGSGTRALDFGSSSSSPDRCSSNDSIRCRCGHGCCDVGRRGAAAAAGGRFLRAPHKSQRGGCGHAMLCGGADACRWIDCARVTRRWRRRWAGRSASASTRWYAAL